MHRFMYHTPGSFFHTGRERRDALVEQNGQIDPLIGQLVHVKWVYSSKRARATYPPMLWAIKIAVHVALCQRHLN